jgi:hypothetical protein
MAFAFDESRPLLEDVAPWKADGPEEITMERLVHVRSFGLRAATNDENHPLHLSPQTQPTLPPTTPRRRHSVTSLSPSPKNKSPAEKKNQVFFFANYEPERLQGKQLERDIMDAIAAHNEDALNRPASSINDVIEKLQRFGFDLDTIEDFFARLVFQHCWWTTNPNSSSLPFWGIHYDDWSD